MDHLQKSKKEYKNLKKEDIHDIFIKTNQIKFFDKKTSATHPWSETLATRATQNEFVGGIIKTKNMSNK